MPFDITTLTPQAQVAAIYIGYYDRAADPFGSAFWESAVANPALTLTNIATDFATQKETLGVHPFFSDPSPEEANAFIAELYLNLFNRIPDVAGLDFWSGVLQNAIAGVGNITVGEIIMQIIAGAQDTAETKDLTTITNKIAVAVAWTDAANEGGLNESSSYGDNAAAQASAKSIIEGVTDDVETLETATSTIRMFEVSLKAAVATDALAAFDEAQAEADEAEAAATDAEGAQAYVQAAAALKTAADQALADALASEAIAKEAKLAAAVTDETEDDVAAAAAFEVAQDAIAAAEAAIEAAEAEIESSAESVVAAQPGDDFTLTIGNDVLTGTTGVDVFFAPLSKDAVGNVQLQTLGFDDIDGDLGIDTLNAVLIDDETEIVDNDDINDLNPVLKSIEILNLTSRSSNGDIELDNADSVQQLWNVGSTADLEVHEVQNGVIIGMKNVDKDTDFYVDYASNALGGDYTQAIVLNGAGADNALVQLDIDVSGDDDIVALDISASGKNFVDLDDAAEDKVEDITISGNGQLVLSGRSNDFDSVETLDAADFSGDLTIDVSGSTALESATLGSGDDSLTVSGAVVTDANSDTQNIGNQELLDPSNDTILDGGEGQNTLVITDVYGSLDFSNVSNFQELVLQDTFGSGFVTQSFRGSTYDLIPLGVGFPELDLSDTDFTSLVIDNNVALDGDFVLVGSEQFDTIDISGNLAQIQDGNFDFILEGFEGVDLTIGGVVGGAVDPTTATGKDVSSNWYNQESDSIFNLVADDLVNATLTLGKNAVVDVNFLDANKLETLELNLGAGARLTGPDSAKDGVVPSAESLETLTINGAATSSAIYLFGTQEESLSFIDLSDMGGHVAIGFNAGGGADIANEDLLVKIGEGDLSYGVYASYDQSFDISIDDSDGSNVAVREVFQFVGDDIGIIEIRDFESSIGNNGDRLDFSMFADIDGIEDLDIVYTGGDTVIRADGEFSGLITIVGADLSSDDFNFIF
jgi:hypothetical protein